MQVQRRQALVLLSGAWHYRYFGIAVAWLVCIAGWIGVALVPDSYQASAVVYIDTQSLLVPLLKGLAVDIDPDQQINVMLRTLLTTPNLETVVRMTRSNVGAMTPLQMQDAVSNLQSKVTLRNAQAKNLFEISYVDANPAKAQQVTESLVDVLVDSNIGTRRHDADDARVFLDGQIADYEHKLRDADARRAAFKTAHLDIFSGQSGGDVVSAKSALATAQTAYDEDVERRNAMRTQLGSTSATVNVSAPSPLVIGSDSPVSRRSELSAARARLDILRTHYTDSYPDVVATKNLIAHLESEVAADKAGGGDEGDVQGISNPAYVMLREKLADYDATVAVDHARLVDAQKHLADSQTNAVSALAIQRQYEDLDRDYKVLHDDYESLVERRESASISQAAGDQQSSFVFKVIGPPKRPDRPVAPNRILFNLLVLLAGLGAGGATAFFASQISNRILTMEQLTKSFSLPTLGAVTVVRSARDILALRLSIASFAFSTGLLLVGYVVVLFFFHTDVATVAASAAL